MAPRPKVTICVPTFNSSSTLRPTLDSISAQTYPNLEIKIVDNASTDETCSIGDEYAARDSRFQVLRHDLNVGGEGNFNRCLSYADGDYVAVFHADDIFHSDMIETQVQCLENNAQVGAVLTHAFVIDGQGVKQGERFFPAELAPRDVTVLDYPALLKLVLKYGNFLTCPSALMRISTLRAGGMRWNGENFGSSADLDLWLRFARAGALAVISRPLMSYRVSVASFSVGLSKVRVSRHPLFKVLDHHFSIGEEEGLLEPQDHRHYRFLLFKDDAFIAFNQMRQQRDPSELRVGFEGAAGLTCLFESRFHLRFGVLAMGIYAAAKAYRWGGGRLLQLVREKNRPTV